MISRLTALRRPLRHPRHRQPGLAAECAAAASREARPRAAASTPLRSSLPTVVITGKRIARALNSRPARCRSAPAPTKRAFPTGARFTATVRPPGKPIVCRGA